VIRKNILLTIIGFVINTVVSFLLAPYVIQKLGVEAYGFVSLGSQFVNYAAIAGIALNSMASRFISIEIHQGNWENANKYFSSVWVANLALIGFLTLPAFGLIYFLNDVLNVSAALLKDVQILFVFLFINYFIGTAFSAFTVSTFVTNKLYLKSWREIEGRLLYAGLLVLLFTYVTPGVYFIGLATSITALYTAAFNWHYLRKFLPQVRISLQGFNWTTVKELISSGIWNTVIHLGQILTQGLDLLIVNLLLGATLMGTLALSKTIPVMFISLVGMIAGVFAPTYTMHYANGNRTELLASVRYSMKVLGVMVNVPVAVFAAFGESFYQLWLPGQNAAQLHQLSVLAMLTVVVSGPINGLYSILTATNRVKANALAVVITGMLNFALVWLLLTQFELGMVTVVVVSLGLGIARNLLFTAPYGAKCLQLPWYAFYPAMYKSAGVFIALYGITIFFKQAFEIINWLQLAVYSFCFILLGLAFNMVLIFDKDELRNFIQKQKSKLNLK
jgi:O-antigen/teichoic acid export membrane protein